MKSWLMNNISIKGIVLGYIAGNVTSITLGLMFALVAGPLFFEDMHDPITLGSTTSVLLSSILFNALSTVVGGYIAARVAKEATYLNSGMIGVIVIVLGLLFGGEHPLWFNVLAYISIPPSALLGGYLASLRQASYDTVQTEPEWVTWAPGIVDGKWVSIGTVVMVVLALIACRILGLVRSPQLVGVTSFEDVPPSAGQIALAALLNSLAFAIGGFIVGLKKRSMMIIEPVMSAMVALAIVLCVLSMSGNLSIVNIIACGALPFVAGVLGGYLGLRRQAALSGDSW
jgi:hypothetical protein